MIITTHADKRGKERFALGKKAFERIIPKVKALGVRHSETKGNLHKYITA